MNILYLTSHLNIGGISSYILTLARGMKKKGHQVYVASSGGALLGRFREEGITSIPIPIKTKAEFGPAVFISLFKLLPQIKEKNIDVIHAHARVTQVLGIFISRLCQKPCVSTCHGFFKPRLLRKLFPCWGDKVIAISAAVKEHLLHDLQVAEKDIRVIYNGIDTAQFKTESREYCAQRKKELGLGGGPVVGIVARLSDVKGHTYLIEAMQAVLKNIPGAQLFIVGEGRIKKDLVALAQRLRIEQNVFFMPAVTDTQKVLSIMDVFVMPSLQEGLGLGLMEAMAAGLAVVGSNVGGIKSLIQDGFNGLLAEPADSRGLSSAILDLLQDEGRRKYLGENARAFVTENFSEEKMVLETERLYLECLGAGS